MEDSATDNDDQVISSRNSPPHLPQDSPGSSVSTRLQEEYSELLRYTVNSVTMNEDDIVPVSKSALDSSLTLNENDIQTVTPNGDLCDTNANYDDSIIPAVVSMGTKLDTWLANLKDNVLDELRSLLIASHESQNKERQKALNQLTAEKVRQEKEINKLNELINSMEQSIARKDTLIDNLTQSLSAQKGKTDMAQKFYCWKASHLDKSRENFTEKLAVQHHNMQIRHKVFKAWFGLIQGKWRSRVERCCQEQAQGVCLQLTNDYEAKITSLNETIKGLESKLANLLEEKETYADSVKKAFMRGVCALNMEAMSAFNPDHPPSETTFFGTSGTLVDTTHSIDLSSNNISSNTEKDRYCKDPAPMKSLPTEISQSSMTYTGDVPMTKDFSQPVSLPMTMTLSSATQKTKSKSGVPGKSRACSAGFKSKNQPQVLAPPMASVVVERHQPVTKQTIGKATALCYPKQNLKETVPVKSKCGNRNKNQASGTTSGQFFKPLAGQDRGQDLMKTQALSVKVVD